MQSDGGVTSGECVVEVGIVRVVFSAEVVIGEGVTVGDNPTGAATVMVLLRISFMDGLLALTKYCSWLHIPTELIIEKTICAYRSSMGVQNFTG